MAITLTIDVDTVTGRIKAIRCEPDNPQDKAEVLRAVQFVADHYPLLNDAKGQQASGRIGVLGAAWRHFTNSPYSRPVQFAPGYKRDCFTTRQVA